MRKILITGAVVAATMAGQASAQQVRIMTGPQGGAWYPLGGAIQSMLSEIGVPLGVVTAKSTASGPDSVRTASSRRAVSERASSQLMRSNLPSPRSPTRFIGQRSRSSPRNVL